MNRRDFIINGLSAVSLAMGSGLLFSSCKRDLRSKLMDGHAVSETLKFLGEDGYKILYYASLAPSGHNAQPWFVKIINPYQWIIGSDPKRWLKVVDPENREALLSLGAFIENLVEAASAFGYQTEIEMMAKGHFDKQVAGIKLSKTKPNSISVQRMVWRRTVKNNMLPTTLTNKDVNDLSKLAGGLLFYFPRGGEHSNLMAEQAVENFKIQFENKDAMAEAAMWTRLKDSDAIKFRDGLTTDGMEINGLAGWYVRHFMDNKDVKGRVFREKGIAKTAKLAREGAGWLVMTSKTNSVEDIIDAGRRFQRMALAAKEKMIAIHPMTQTLEEGQGQKKIRENHESHIVPQFMLRVGYVEKYPNPVTLRRPVEWFVRR